MPSAIKRSKFFSKATSSLTSLNTELTRRRLNVNRENTYSKCF